MNLKRTAAILALGVAAFGPAAAGAHSSGGHAMCSAGLPDETSGGENPTGLDQTITLPDGTTLYLDLETGAVWEESNAKAGLQTHDHACKVSPHAEPGSGNIPADSRVAP